MIIRKKLIKRKIANDTILVPVGETVYDSNGLFVMNELADFIWDLLPEAGTAEELCDAVLKEYEVSREEAMKDITDFLETLRKMQII